MKKNKYYTSDALRETYYLEAKTEGFDFIF